MTEGERENGLSAMEHAALGLWLADPRHPSLDVERIAEIVAKRLRGLAPLSKEQQLTQGDAREVMERCAKILCAECAEGEERKQWGCSCSCSYHPSNPTELCAANRIWTAISELGQTPEREGKS